MNKLFMYKIIDVDDDENYIYLCTSDDCCVDIEELFNTLDKDRIKLCDELDLLGVEYYIIFPGDVVEVF